jgi:hypothetical protein
MGFNVSPIDKTKDALDLIEKSYTHLSKEDLKYLRVIKERLLIEMKRGDEAPVVEALEVGYNKKLEESLGSALEFFRFPI